VLINQDFTHSASIPNAWHYGGGACLTAGYSQTPPTSIPACGSQAPEDPGGWGVLELTPPANFQQGFAIWNTPLSTSAGLVMSFNYFSYNSSGNVGDGLALVLADASVNAPALGGCCGSFDYAPFAGNPVQPGLADGYLAVGLDESGYWTCTCNGKTGGSPFPVPNIITVRGSDLVAWDYLLSSSILGHPSQLPYPLSAGRSNHRPPPQTYTVTLSSAGVLSLTVDLHNGLGPVPFIPPTNIVGLNGQPAVPSNVYIGFTSSQGGANARHDISDVYVTTQF
jgi:hypothetical protein